MQRYQYIKKGRLHSPNALARRALEWKNRWNSFSYNPDNVFKELTFNDEEFKTVFDKGEDISAHPDALKGFKSNIIEKSFIFYYMTQDAIENLDMEIDFSSEEDDESEDDTEDNAPISFEVKFTEKFLMETGDLVEEDSNTAELINQVGVDDDDEGEDPEDESVRCRPVSRISLMLPCCDDDADDSEIETDVVRRPLSSMSRSGYKSYYETDDEDDAHRSKNKNKGIYGHIPGIRIGTIWKSRRQVSRRSVHRPQHAGIHGGPKGAYSMMLSTDYAVIDRGEEFDFKGEGGRDPRTKKLVRDQEMKRGNLSLRENIQTGNPVRVIRGFQLNNRFSPEYGFRYDGLYEVTQCTMDKKIDGFKVFMFTFVRCPRQPPPPWHNVPIELSLPWHVSGSCHQLSDSDEEHSHIENPRKKRKRKRKVADHSTCSTPTSVASNEPPPELHKMDVDIEQPIVYPNPPCLSPSLTININTIDITKRPVLLLTKLEDIYGKPFPTTIKISEIFINTSNSTVLPKRKRQRRRQPSKDKHKMKTSEKRKDIKVKNVKEQPPVKRKRNNITPIKHIPNVMKPRRQPKKVHPDESKHNIKKSAEKKKRGRPKLLVSTEYKKYKKKKEDNIHSVTKKTSIRVYTPKVLPEKKATSRSSLPKLLAKKIVRSKKATASVQKRIPVKGTEKVQPKPQRGRQKGMKTTQKK